MQEPDEERLQDLAGKLGTAKKEVMAMNRSLVVGQPASFATEAHELASEAGVRYAARTGQNGHEHSVSARLDAVFIEL